MLNYDYVDATNISTITTTTTTNTTTTTSYFSVCLTNLICKHTHSKTSKIYKIY